jgi:hypothetical protein
LVTNGDFSNGSTDWTLGTGWSIGTDKAICDGTQTSGTQLSQNGTYTINKTYKITYTVEVTSGSVDVRLQGGGTTVVGNVRTTSGTYTDYLLSTGNTSFRVRGNSDFIGSVTNISAIEVTDDTNLPRINYDGFSYDGSGAIIPNSGCGSWLWEPQSTNLITQSKDFSDASWTKI